MVGPMFEVKEYSFPNTPTHSASQFRYKMELLDKYKETKEVVSNEALKLYSEVRKISKT